MEVISQFPCSGRSLFLPRFLFLSPVCFPSSSSDDISKSRKNEIQPSGVFRNHVSRSVFHISKNAAVLHMSDCTATVSFCQRVAMTDQWTSSLVFFING